MHVRLPHTLALVLILATLGCSGSAPTNPTTPGGSTPPPPTGSSAVVRVRLTASGADVRAVTVPLGGRVLVTNDDTRVHEFVSDPHPEHTDCPELNQIGYLPPGQSRESGNLVTARTCGFHDHLQPGNSALRGRITVASQ